MYLVIRYIEEPSDYIAYKENPEFKGHRRMAEKFKLEFTNVEPDPERDIELARVQLTRDVSEIKDARNPYEPAENEIDLRFVPKAGVSGTLLTPQLLWRIGQVLQKARGTYSYLAFDLGLGRAQSVLTSVLSMDMMLRSGQIRRSNLIEMLEMLLLLQQEVIVDLDAQFPQQASSKEFLNFKNQIRYQEQLFQEDRTAPDFLENVLAFLGKACEALEKFYESRRTVRKPEQGLSLVELWEKVKTSSESFGSSLTLDKQKFKRVDELDVLDKASEKAHEFALAGAADMYRSRQTFKYPDSEGGTAVKDQGVAFEGGKCTFTINKVKVKRDLILLFRIDYTYGEWEGQMRINGQRAVPWTVEGRDRTYRWRNWPYIIPAELVEEDSIQVEIEFVKAARDINLFRVWAFQAA